MKLKGPPGRPYACMILGALALTCQAAPSPSPQAAPSATPGAAQLIDQGDAEVKAMHAEAALALFDQAARADPDDPAILLRVSQQCSNMIAQAKSPADALAYAKRSLDDAKQAEALAPDNSKAHLAVAVAYGRLIDFMDDRTKVEYSRYVKSEAEKAAELDPKEDFAYHVLGRWNYRVSTMGTLLKLIAKYVYGGMPDASLEEAVRDFQKAIEIAPQRVIHHHELARTYVAMGRMDDARKEWQTELTLKPEDNEGVKDQEEARAELKKN